MTTESTQHESDVPAIDDWNRLLEGKVAIVTGGGAGIGGAISAQLSPAHGQVQLEQTPPTIERALPITQ